MNWPGIVPQAVATVLALALCNYAWRHREMAGASSFALLMVAVAFWTTTDMLQALVGGYTGDLIWTQIGMIGPASVPPLWLNFAIRYTGLSARTYAGTVVLLAVIPVITAGLALSAPVNQLLFRQLDWVRTHMGPSAVDYGPWFWVHAAYSYFACLLGVAVFVVLSARKPRLYRQQAAVAIIAAGVPLTANLLAVTRVVSYDATSVCFAVTGVALAVGFLRLGVLDVVPIARDAVMENLQEGVVVLDSVGRIVDINPMAERMFGLGVSKAIGTPSAEAFVQWPDMIAHCTSMEKAEAEITLDSSENRRHYSLATIPLLDQRSRRSGLLVILHDVTELQESYRKLQELGRLKDDLTNMIVHDLRTPLTSITTSLVAMERMGGLDDCRQEMLGMGINRGQALLGMIDDLLDISRMESESLKLEFSEIDLGGLVRAVHEQMDSLASEKHQTLVSRVAPGVGSLRADEDMLRRTITNLLANAIKFTPEYGTITLAVEPFDEGDSVLFTVMDTGEGIPEEAFERIFEKFGQVETRKSGRKMSTGLGLTLCKMVAEAHGGRIWVESELEQGSKFSVVIPRRS